MTKQQQAYELARMLHDTATTRRELENQHSRKLELERNTLDFETFRLYIVRSGFATL
jgi:hypothetical protein